MCDFMNNHYHAIVRSLDIYWHKIKTNQAINLLLGRENLDINELITNSVGASFSTEKLIVFSVPANEALEDGLIQWVKCTKDIGTEIIAQIFDTRAGAKRYNFILDKKEGIRYQANAVTISNVAEYAKDMNYTLNTLNKILREVKKSSIAA